MEKQKAMEECAHTHSCYKGHTTWVGGGRPVVVGQAIHISILAGEQHLSPSIHSWFMCAAHLNSISIFALTKNEGSNYINKISHLRGKIWQFKVVD